ncbi:glutamine-hydrolyzing GMP synthase [Candidatus Roizmanbacteria bacterium RIFCSPLOWO2_01_FULL_37_12]|uniref:GMP synthase [glutamine-hydrolyzing] n=1 Tax=Candidatus Roizmanbacteria bacterium RIFCSPLOWO2_01_FULL_37_12 TaxID=1802056 RepID=A0A1F7ID77_9BACT|nr:MAG: glutamine-hydrolyzing GMP synthase [Candidatus Roizmanbacteria bacterium RIFCSPHIGHO2_02_FULL_37_9b]OGK41312.1 MAG: glutamine-hydrolyzing GMP synthase [Candidatus Roizmanbacteria bacterium RIFCSPLOWO2_01_FULL_37_12]
MILVVDFGSQTTHLIGRRIRDLGVKSELVLPQNTLASILKLKPKGIILSGGPASVYGKKALLIDKTIFNLGIPILGICYGLEVIGQVLGGKVKSGIKKEYGPTLIRLNNNYNSSNLFKNIPKKEFRVWMSHFDQVVRLPKNMINLGSTPTVRHAAFSNEKNNIFAIMFHPEVHHTQFGEQILNNFIFKISSENKEIGKDKIEEIKKNISKNIEHKKAVCALSGGIDSAVAGYLAYKVIGKKLTNFYVDTGLMRDGETEEIKNTFKKMKLPMEVIYGKKYFLKALRGITDPEKKRKAIGETFVRLFEKEAKIKGAKILIQGTIYPDVIESQGTKHSHKIKTHHNVGGLPQKHGFKIIEPLRQFYKDEVRKIAADLNFPKEIIYRHVFPGPGLAVRIIGEVTERKLEILKKADTIIVEEIKKAGLYEKIWMAFGIFAGIKTTGVTGDERKYGETIAIRAIESKDTMTADWSRLPYDVLEKIAERITTEVFEVVRVVYDITTKPPATMEWE